MPDIGTLETQSASLSCATVVTCEQESSGVVSVGLRVTDESRANLFLFVAVVSLALIVAGVLLHWSWWVEGPLMGVLAVNMLWGLMEAS